MVASAIAAASMNARIRRGNGAGPRRARHFDGPAHSVIAGSLHCVLLRVIRSFGIDSGPPDGMSAVYICLCNALTDQRLKQAVAASGSQRPCDVYAACGCRAQCGQCVRAVLRLVRDHARQGELELPAAT
jgi:bacterioferritin-associated ferredoxin